MFSNGTMDDPSVGLRRRREELICARLEMKEWRLEAAGVLIKPDRWR